MKLKDFNINELKPNTKYILCVDQQLSKPAFNAFKKELDKWLKDADVSFDSFLFLMNATIVELPTKPKTKKGKKDV